MPPPFLLYVEGPRDRELLSVFARKDSRELERAIDANTVILGGRQPARALEHFEHARIDAPNLRGLCVLDRDDLREATPEDRDDLEFFTWGRRHIESYLLVPRALRAALAPRDDPRRLDRVIQEEVPAGDDEAAFAELDAKRLLGSKGAFAKALGRTPDVTRVARNLRLEELHSDVHGLLGRLRQRAGLASVDVVVRNQVDFSA